MGFESSRAGNCSETPINEIAPRRSGTTEFYHSGEQLPRSTSLLRAAVYALERLAHAIARQTVKTQSRGVTARPNHA